MDSLLSQEPGVICCPQELLDVEYEDIQMEVLRPPHTTQIFVLELQIIFVRIKSG